MSNRINNFLKNLTIEELKEVRSISEDLIYNYDDGFKYECKVRSYGRNWTLNLPNSHSVQDLCYQYSGDYGIVDVYTTNPNLNLYNYGDTYYFPTLEDAEKWRTYEFLLNNIPNWKKELEEWDDRENVPFKYRPLFAPIYNAKDIEAHEQELINYEKEIINPVRLTYNEPDEN
jgi:hypothetical protein